MLEKRESVGLVQDEVFLLNELTGGLYHDQVEVGDRNVLQEQQRILEQRDRDSRREREIANFQQLQVNQEIERANQEIERANREIERANREIERANFQQLQLNQEIRRGTELSNVPLEQQLDRDSRRAIERELEMFQEVQQWIQQLRGTSPQQQQIQELQGIFQQQSEINEGAWVLEPADAVEMKGLNSIYLSKIYRYFLNNLVFFFSF